MDKYRVTRKWMNKREYYVVEEWKFGLFGERWDIVIDESKGMAKFCKDETEAIALCTKLKETAQA